MSFESKKTPNKPVFEELDLSKAETWRGREGMRDLIVQRLKVLGLYTPDLIFSGFDGRQVKVAKKDSSYIGPKGVGFYGTTEADLASETRVEHSALDYAFENDTPALAIYSKEKLVGKSENNNLDTNQYQPRKGFFLKDALIAVFLLKE